eukprot:scaffold132965_cov63-Phaeocystis_antarctica.AAC.1
MPVRPAKTCASGPSDGDALQMNSALRFIRRSSWSWWSMRPKKSASIPASAERRAACVAE